ncbi:MAG: class I SAM-dependent methyltransferase [Phycisphaerales bacterium]|nr:class I SAM-dependent methyltransferase [Phycisphaerales bacterium]
MTKPIAGDVDYSKSGIGYAQQRRPDPRIEALIHAALGDARTVLNVGAGAGSYEPRDRHVIAIEPSETMRKQRPRDLVPAINGRAEALPLDDASVDASMAIVTVHQWHNLEAGLRELRRVTRGPIVVVGFDGDALARFWLADYVPELVAAGKLRDPAIDYLVDRLSTPKRRATVRTVPIPIDCVDGVVEAYYARPERFLDPDVMRAQSTWNFVAEDVKRRFVETLAADLRSGEWDRRYGAWRTMPCYEGAMRIIVGGEAG